MQSDLLSGDPIDCKASTLQLLVASEVRFLCDCLGEILSRDHAMRVVGYAYDCDRAVGLSHELRPDMLLLDAGMRDGLAAVRRLRQSMADLPVVVFAVSESVKSVLLWAEAGIAGYIPSGAALTDLHALVLDISAGRQACLAPVSAALLRKIATYADRLPGPQLPSAALTPRETEIIRLIASGLSNKEIARLLNIGVTTTKSHVHSVLTKLNLQRRGQAADWIRARAEH